MTGVLVWTLIGGLLDGGLAALIAAYESLLAATATGPSASSPTSMR
jgi:hypothetical protein